MDKFSQNFIRETKVIECPKSVVGRVIGKNGETIKALQIYTGALIQIDQTQEPMNINITGTQPSLQLAVSMVYDIIHRNFKGFALLRQIAITQNNNLDFKGDSISSLPTYSPGYGFVPPSQTKRQANPSLETLTKLQELESLQQLKLQALSQLQNESNLNKGQGVDEYALANLGKPVNALSQGEQRSPGGKFLPNITSNSEIPSRASADTIHGSPFNGSPPLSTNNVSPGDKWSVLCDPDGKLFYYNQETGETSWSNPYAQQDKYTPFQNNCISSQLDMIFGGSNQKVTELRDTDIFTADSQNSHLSAYSQM